MVDVMVLVAAAGVGCAMTAAVGREMGGSVGDEWWGLFAEPCGDWALDGSQRVLTGVGLGMPIIGAMSLAWVLVAWRRLGPECREELSRPGMMAGMAVGLAFVMAALPEVLVAAASSVANGHLVVPKWDLWGFWIVLTMTSGVAVASCWSALFFGNGWRAERSGLDQMGRLLGGTWVIAGLAVWLAWEYQGSMILCSLEGRSIGRADVVNNALRVIGWVERATPGLAAATVAAIPICVLASLPRSKRRGPQPGLVGLGAVAAAMAVAALPRAIFTMANVGGSQEWERLGWGDVWELITEGETLVAFAPFGSVAVAASWMALLVGRRWRGESTWVDWVARAVGAGWILAWSVVTACDVVIGTFDRA